MSEIDTMLKELRDCAMKIAAIEEDLRRTLSGTADIQTRLSAAKAFERLQNPEDIGYATEENGGWADREEGIRYAD